MKRIVSLILITSFLSSAVCAQDEVFSIKKSTTNTQEFYSGNYSGSVMMKVNLVGGVQRPGVYNVPVNTELNSVITHAGGPIEKAQLDKIMVRSKMGDGYAVKNINLKDFFSDAEQQPYRLRPDDYVYVQVKDDYVNNETLRLWLTISAVVGSILSAITIDRTLQR